MPEEIENLEDENNVSKEGASSSKSTPRNTSNKVSKLASNIMDFNKYKARKNAGKGNIANAIKNNSGNNLKSSALNKGSSAINGLKNKAANAMLDKVSNAHPALKALSLLNNLNNARKNKKAAIGGGESDDSAASNASERTGNDTTSTSTEDEKSNSSFNPLGAILGSKNGILGGIQIFGNIPLPIKLALVFGVPFFCLMLILMPVILIFGVFSPLFGTNEVVAGTNLSGNSGSINYGDYVLSSEGDEILHQPLDQFLASKGTSLEEFNALIASNVEKNGYGTREGVVTAAVTLIAELGNNYNVKVPYFWGGGHADGVVDGALGYWGSTQCHTYANGQSYNYCGLDCSGFVPWAIKNGGFNITPLVTGGFQSLPGAERVSLTNSAVLQPGDLLESSGHVILIVGVDENNYICAEAAGNETGVLFSTHPFNASGYWGVNMEGFYNTRARS